jgi:hypothetical protein
MGLLDRLKQRARAEIATFTDHPRPNGDVEGDPARAVIVEKRSQGTVEAGVANQFIFVDLVLRLVGDDAGTTTTEVRAYVAPRAAALAKDGREVPVRLDPETGALAGLDAAAWEQEAAAIDAGHDPTPRSRRDGGGPAVGAG